MQRCKLRCCHMNKLNEIVIPCELSLHECQKEKPLSRLTLVLFSLLHCFNGVLQ